MVQQTVAKTISAQKKTAKLKYPGFKFYAKFDEAKYKGEEDHGRILKDLIGTICKHETKTIDDWAKEDPVGCKELQTQGVLESVRTVLDTLPKHVNMGASSHYEPEIAVRESKKSKALRKKLSEVEKLAEKMHKAKADFRLLTVQTLAREQPHSVKSNDVDESLNTYKDILNRMDDCCQAVLSLNNRVNQQLITSRQMQDSLYDKYNEKRSRSMNGKAPSDPKDILRTLPKLLNK